MQPVKKNIKRYYSKILHVVLPFFWKNIDNYIGIEYLKRKVKNSKRIYILATGSSINNYTDEDFLKIGKHDSIAINFFTIHEFNPSLYSAETHADSFNYFQSIKKDCGVPILYKGFSTPSKIVHVISNLNKASQLKHNVLLAKERTTNKFLEDCIKSESDYLFDYSNSLLFWIGVAIKMGYLEIILCGVDMDSEYFYCQDNAPEKYVTEARSRGLCAVENVHKVATDPSRRKIIDDALSCMLDHYENRKDLCPVKVHHKSCALSNYFEILE